MADRELAEDRAAAAAPSARDGDVLNTSTDTGPGFDVDAFYAARARIEARLGALGAGDDPDVVFGDEADADLITLLVVVTLGQARRPLLDIERSCLIPAVYLVGMMFEARARDLPVGEAGWTNRFAWAVRLLAPFAPLVGVGAGKVQVPPRIRGLLGATADSQAGFGIAMLEHALEQPDAVALGVGIDLLTSALRRLPAGHPQQAARYTNLALGHLLRHERRASHADIDEMLAAAARRVWGDFPDARPMHATFGPPQAPWLARDPALDVWPYRARAAKLRPARDRVRVAALARGSVEDVELAIAAAARAVKLATAARRDLPLRALATRIRHRGARSGPVGDPDAAVLLEVRALGFLAMALRVRFELTGADADHAEALAAAHRASGLEDEYALPGGVGMSEIASCRLAHYRQNGDIAHLIEEADARREALRRTPPGHPSRALRLNTLSTTLRALHQIEISGPHIEEAVGLLREAAASAAQSATRVDSLLGLANALHEQSELSSMTRLQDRPQAAASLAEAAEAARAAIGLIPAGDPREALALDTLSHILATVSERSDDPAARREAASVARAALEAAPTEADRAALTATLASVYMTEFEYEGDPSALDEARRLYAEAAEDRSAPVRTRIMAYRSLAQAASLGVADGPGMLAAMEGAVELLPVVVASARRPGTRGAALAQLPSLAGRAATAAVAAGDPVRAVQLLELTRGVLVTEILASRGGVLSRLRTADPALAESMAAAGAAMAEPGRAMNRGQVETAALGGAGTARGTARTSERPARQDAYGQWAELVDRVRATEGFADYLRPPDAADLAALGEHGAVVFITTSSFGCKALLVTGSEAEPVRVVDLPGLTDDGAYEHVLAFALAALDAAYVPNRPKPARDLIPDDGAATNAHERMLAELGWLWDTVAEPVLRALGHTTSPAATGGRWPRVWWSPVGALSALPIHAAGWHEDLVSDDLAARANPRTVLDRAVSSYIPTLRSLAYARARAASPNTAASALIIAAPDAPGLSPLPYARTESEYVSRLLPNTLLLDSPATCNRASVLNALPEHAIAHFCCHGRADMADPATDGLLLYDHNDAALTVADLSALQLDADLAYLSSCESNSPNAMVRDEAVNLSGAFHLAGFRHVIGTLWPVGDASAADFAQAFYQRITANGTRPANTDAAPSALHETVREARAAQLDSPITWACYTHTGS